MNAPHSALISAETISFSFATRNEAAMADQPDPQLVRELARETMRRAACDPSGAFTGYTILLQRPDTDAGFADLHAAVAAAITNATVTVTWPDEPTATADFFQAGRTYIQARPYAPPEALVVFRCLTVGEFPGGYDDVAGEPVAFGFAKNGRYGDIWWVSISRRDRWAEGWTEYAETESEAG